MTRPLKKPLYDNILILSPSNEALCRCNMNKAQWYLSHNLATVVSDSPLVIKLAFEPKGLGHFGDDFYLSSKKNLCVVCGTQDNLTRHHIVPCCFRKHFPEKYKRFNSHDIVLVCITCHESYEKKADEFKNELSLEYQVPSFTLPSWNSDELVKKIDDLHKFIVRWRQHFIDQMSPKFMPDYWTIER